MNAVVDILCVVSDIKLPGYGLRVSLPIDAIPDGMDVMNVVSLNGREKHYVSNVEFVHPAYAEFCTPENGHEWGVAVLEIGPWEAEELEDCVPLPSAETPVHDDKEDDSMYLGESTLEKLKNFKFEDEDE